MDLLAKYAPKRLDDIRGQSSVVRQLKAFAGEPHSNAFLFHGGTGVGKTATAHALLVELGNSRGVFDYSEIRSGEQNAESVRESLSSLYCMPMVGKWRGLVVNEAERQSEAVKALWLDALEKLPRHAIVIFTTNYPEKFEQRFRDRCDDLAFNSDRKRLRLPIREMANHIWKAEVGEQYCPIHELDLMPESKSPSFRYALRVIERELRNYGSTPEAETDAEPDGPSDPVEDIQHDADATGGFVTVAEVAKAMGVTRSHIYDLVNSGLIRSIKMGPKVTRIPVEELRRLKAEGC